MGRALAGAGTIATPTQAGAGRPLEVRLPQDPWIELRALAKSLGREPDALAAELLAAAVSDAKSYLDEDRACSRRELLVEDLPGQQPGVAFDTGAP